jgi:aminoglycoside phosphotransferase family enzyme/predicted kinase
MTQAELLEQLRRPASFPHGPDDVELVQTHLSIVCLAGDLVYKLKKTRKFPFVDFSQLARRRQACRDEVRLNRRLCPDTYLGTSSLRRTGDGLRFAPIGDDDGPDDVDVAVVMKRLPADRMLDELLRQHRATRAEIERLAAIVANFHAGGDRGPEAIEAGNPERLVRFAADNFAELRAVPDHGLPPGLLQQLEATQAADFTRLMPALLRRAANGRVVDGHGDLHTRNVCMTDPPAIYDCIEFEPAFRCGDVATENAFLVMDLRYRGAPDLAEAYVESYVAASGDVEQPDLLPPLAAYRALVRAKVSALVAADRQVDPDDREGARHSARRHLLLAGALAVEARGPHWLLVCGPPASGKSLLCVQLATTADWPCLETDLVRKSLAGVPPTERARPEHYSEEFSRRTYAEVLRRASAATARGKRVVLLDGNFPTAAHRDAARAAAAAAGARLAVAFVDVSAEVAAQRAIDRAKDPNSVSDAGAEVTAKLRAAYEPPATGEGSPVVSIDGTRPVHDLAAELLATLLRAQVSP